MKKTIAILLSAVLLASMLSIAVSAASWKNESDWTVINEEGDVAFPNAYGYVFDIDYVNGTIGGEDATIIDNSDSYATCNPNWAISVALDATETEGVYSVLKVVETPGSAAAAGINWLEAELVMVVHSATSNPADADLYPNWESKVAALALTEGVLVKYEGTTVTVQNEDGTFPEAPAEGDDEDDSSAAPEKVLKNLAAGATYTASEQYRQGGADVQWGWDDNAPYAYPDEEGKTLTDGVKPADDADCYAVEWAGWTGIHPDYADYGYNWFTIDLGETKEIANVNVWHGTAALQNGINAPENIQVFVSEDGENFTEVGSAVPANDANVVNECTSIAAVASARYVQVRVVAGNWAFLSEIEVEGYVEVENSEEETPDAGDASSMLVFAVIALIAIAGSAVVVKTRR